MLSNDDTWSDMSPAEKLLFIAMDRLMESGIHPVDEILSIVNRERRRRGISPVMISDWEMGTAQAKADDMLDRDYYGHVDPDGNGPAAAENIAEGYMTAKDVMTAWMKSQGHKSNILNPQWRFMGVGYTIRENGRVVWCQHFA